MFEYIRGTLVSITPEKAVVDVNGIGYQIHIPLSCYADGLKIESEITFYTCFVVREDSQRLFGFSKKEERELFILLSEVSGVGPKTALNLIGHLGSDSLEQAILSANTATLSKVPGIGRKTAERLALEMRDKIHKLKGPKIPYIPGKPDLKNDAVSALVNLGYSSTQATKATDKVLKELGEEPPLTKLIAAALKTI
ncbi:MAG: Holliday junction branch migration protein RuvA [Candidatus Algichlamydia australiensis]|nr:Holliday junction branch migration protein RuvA [Chlamydiales bacterium]